MPSNFWIWSRICFFSNSVVGEVLSNSSQLTSTDDNIFRQTQEEKKTEITKKIDGNKWKHILTNISNLSFDYIIKIIMLAIVGVPVILTISLLLYFFFAFDYFSTSSIS